MFTVKCNKKNAIVWDGEADRLLARFKDGVFSTEDETVARRLQALGYDVEGPEDAGEDIGKLTVEQLKAYAAEKGIDLKDAKKKDEIIAVIKEDTAKTE